MSEEIVRCPYCVLGNEFRPMLQHRRKWFLCLVCGHRATPGRPYIKCACLKCQEMDRIAIQHRSQFELRRREAPDLSVRS